MIASVLQASNLYKAAHKVMQNKGASGIDGMPVSKLPLYIRANRERITTSIYSNGYIPQAILGVPIPKEKGKSRLLGIPTVVDRCLQQAVSQMLMTKFEYEFEPFSYGFRPKKNIQKAVLQAQEYINDGFQDVVDIDLKGFFDEVDHSLLLQLVYNKVNCPATLRLIRKWLRAPILIKGHLVKRRKGIPQGSPLSPLLSNILLDVLDKFLSNQGLCYVRYADDFSIYVRSKESAKRVGNSIYTFLRDKLHLPINREKSGRRKPVNFNLLGFGFVPTYKKGEKGKYQLVVKQSKWEELKAKLKAITRKTIPASFDERIYRINLLIRGWINYFKKASIHQKLKKLDEWLRNRLRYCIWTVPIAIGRKKPDRKRKNLIRLGINQGQAYAWSRTRMGGWATAQSPILITTITKDRLKKSGYMSMLEYFLQVK